MSATITLSNLSWRAPDGAGFSDLNLTFAAERTGLIGRNGVGKTTLLKIIEGAVAPASGAVAINGTIGVLRQSLQPAEGETVAGLFGAAGALALLARAEAGEAGAAELAEADWTLEARIEAALAETGLDATPDTPLTALSGGQRTRAALAALVFARPDFILLDEPTNNLDRAGRADVRRLLERWRSGAIVVSHDRELLESMDAIVELTTLGATRFGGGWSLYRERKALELAGAEHDLAEAGKRAAQAARNRQAAVERKAQKDAAGRRKGARGDMPKIVLGGLKRQAENTGGALTRLAEKQGDAAEQALAAAREKVEILQPLTVALPSTGLPAARRVLSLDRVTAGYEPDRPILSDFSMEMVGPERVALTGPNGSGKSTVLALIAGRLAPWSGEARVHVPFALLDQQVGLLDPALSIDGNFRRLNPDATENQRRAALARFLFRADAALQIAGTMSGGQMLRAGLACVTGGPNPPQLLILDEPTNHLDIRSVETVEAGLKAYDGALLVVSHDAAFLDNIGVTRRIGLGSAPRSGC